MGLIKPVIVAVVLVIVALLLGVFLAMTQDKQTYPANMPLSQQLVESSGGGSATLVFELKQDYGGYYIGTNSNYTAKNVILLPQNLTTAKTLFSVSIARLSGNYYAKDVFNDSKLVSKLVVFNKSIPDATSIYSQYDIHQPGEFDTHDMNQDEYNSYLIDSHPLIQAYFCETPSGLNVVEISELNSIVVKLSQGQVPNGCVKIQLQN